MGKCFWYAIAAFQLPSRGLSRPSKCGETLGKQCDQQRHLGQSTASVAIWRDQQYFELNLIVPYGSRLAPRAALPTSSSSPWLSSLTKRLLLPRMPGEQIGELKVALKWSQCASCRHYNLSLYPGVLFGGVGWGEARAQIGFPACFAFPALRFK
jgi:hypothetical protein